MLPGIRVEEVRRLLEASGQADIVDDPIFGGDLDDGMLEHLVHEIAHGQELGIARFTAHTPRAVSQILGGSPHPERHEARVLAAQWLAWPRLGLGYGWDELCEAAQMQGVSPRELEIHLRRPEILALAEATVVETLRLCGPIG